MSVDSSIGALQTVVTDAVNRVSSYANTASSVELRRYAYPVVDSVSNTVADVRLVDLPNVDGVDPNSLADAVVSAIDGLVGSTDWVTVAGLNANTILAGTSRQIRSLIEADSAGVTIAVRREFSPAVARVGEIQAAWAARGFRSSQPRMGGDAFSVGASAFEATHVSLAAVHERRAAAVLRLLQVLADTVVAEYRNAVGSILTKVSNYNLGEDVRNSMARLLLNNKRQALANAKAVAVAKSALEDVKVSVAKTNLGAKETLDDMKTKYSEAAMDVIINGALAKATAMGSVGSAARSAQNVIVGVIASATE